MSPVELLNFAIPEFSAGLGVLSWVVLLSNNNSIFTNGCLARCKIKYLTVLLMYFTGSIRVTNML